MNKRSIDKTKKSNIKCEHCEHWIEPTSKYSNGYCKNDNSPRFDKKCNYWNRCKYFKWAEKGGEEEPLCTYTDEEVAKSFIEDVSAVEEQLPK